MGGNSHRKKLWKMNQRDRIFSALLLDFFAYLSDFPEPS